MKRLLVCAALLAAAGCGSGPTYVPVSGTVTLDGQPLAGVMVIFQPTAAGGGSDAGGVGSTARTDAQGKYTLDASTPDPKRGALVGSHTVRIATPPPAGSATGDPDSDAANAPQGAKAFRDPVPARYNTATTLTFDVPAGGTDKADFALTKEAK